MTKTNVVVWLTAALTAGTATLQAEEPAVPATAYVGGPVELATALNGAIANKRILDGVEKVGWLEPPSSDPWKASGCSAAMGWRALP